MQVFRFISRGHGLWTFFVLAGLLVSAGCPPASGPTGTVSGTVTINGEPAPVGTTVAFVSDQGFAAGGQVAPGGKYELTVAGKDKQIPAATYKVMLSPPGGGGPTEADADYEKIMQGGATAATTAPGTEEIIPTKYRSTATSGLSYTVEAGSNTININIGEEGAAPEPAEKN
jgi:hypothetical protein